MTAADPDAFEAGRRAFDAAEHDLSLSTAREIVALLDSVRQTEPAQEAAA